MCVRYILKTVFFLLNLWYATKVKKKKKIDTFASEQPKNVAHISPNNKKKQNNLHEEKDHLEIFEIEKGMRIMLNVFNYISINLIQYYHDKSTIVKKSEVSFWNVLSLFTKAAFIWS